MLTGEKDCRFVCKSKGVIVVKMPRILDDAGGCQGPEIRSLNALGEDGTIYFGWS